MALENMAASFSGLPMGDLIGGPLNASCEAQVRLAMATADFIKVIGFNAPSDPNNAYSGGTRTALFKFKRPVQLSPAKPAVLADPNATPPVAASPAVPAVIKLEEVEIEVPVLVLVKVPALSITSVDITFDMEVKSSESSKASTDASASLEAEATFGWGPVKGKVAIKGSVATHKENTRSSDNSAKYHVEVHAKDAGMPEGLARVLDILAQAVAPKAISAPA
jgi:hypothetical protein